MSCPYYKFESRLFGGDYYCIKQEKEVSTDIYYKYCRNYDYEDCPIYKHQSSSGGCYLTSACVVARGIPVDCEVLTVLRDLRDNWLKHQPTGVLDIAEYYDKAPKIVEKINALPDSRQIWEELYLTLVLPCVEMIKAGEMEGAYRLYKQTAQEFIERFSE